MQYQSLTFYYPVRVPWLIPRLRQKTQFEPKTSPCVQKRGGMKDIQPMEELPKMDRLMWARR